MNIAENLVEYYASNDFQGNYWECLLEDTSACVDRIIASCKDYDFEKVKGHSIDLTRDEAYDVLDYLRNNLDDFVKTFNGYWVGSQSVDSSAFGEQYECLKDLESDLSLEELKVQFEEANFYVNDDFEAYYDMSSEGVHVDLLMAKIPVLEAKLMKFN